MRPPLLFIFVVAVDVWWTVSLTNYSRFQLYIPLAVLAVDSSHYRTAEIRKSPDNVDVEFSELSYRPNAFLTKWSEEDVRSAVFLDRCKTSVQIILLCKDN